MTARSSSSIDRLRRPKTARSHVGDFAGGLGDRAIWYMRTLAWVWVAKGLFHWAIILGAFPTLGQFTTMALPLQATIVAFACLDLLAAIGLWLAAAWGGAIWLLCAVVEAASPILSPRAAAIGYGGALLNIALVAGYFLLSWRAARERA